MASAVTFPSGLSYYVPINVTNSQSSATSNPFNVLINVTVSAYSSYMTYTGSTANFEFFNSTGSIIPAWIQENNSGTLNIWLKIQQSIAAGSHIQIYLGFAPKTTNLLSSSGTSGVGEAPQLSPTYGQYDDGGAVFIAYWNFAGTSLPSGLNTLEGGTGGSYSVSNSLSLSETTSGNDDITVYGSVSSTGNLTVGTDVLSFSSSTNPNAQIELGVSQTLTLYNSVYLENSYFQALQNDNYRSMYYVSTSGANELTYVSFTLNPGIYYLAWNDPNLASFYNFAGELSTSSSALSSSSYIYVEVYQNFGVSIQYLYAASGEPGNVMPSLSFSSVQTVVYAYTVTFTESGLPSGTIWYLNITGQPSLSSTGTTISTSLSSATYSYTVATGDKIYSPSPSSGSFTVSNAAYSASVTFNEVTYGVTFTQSGLASGTWYLNVTTTSQTFSEPYSTSSVTFNEPNGTYSYTVSTNYKTDKPSPSSGSFTVNGAALSEPISFSEVTYSVTFTESGLSSGTWYLNVSTTGQDFSEPSTTTSISFSEPNGTYSYTVSTGYKIDSPSPDSGSFTVNGAAVSQSITFSTVTYTVTFTETGLPSGTKWYANITGQSSLSSTGTSVSTTLTNGSYTYSIGTPDKTYSAQGGSFTVNGGTVSETVTFNLVTYSVTFTENGLPSGTKWYLNISGQSSLNSTSTSISISLINNSYSYTIATGDKIYSPTPSSGSFTVSGAAITETITFNEVTYAIAFTETGLPSSTKWYVNITSGDSYSSTASSITLPEPNGSYSYSVASGDKQYSPSPFSGGFTVNGGPVSESVTFSLVTFEVTYTESGLPAGTKWYLNVSGQSYLSSTGTTISTYEPNGTYAFTIATGNKIYNPNPSSGSFTVNGAAVSGTVSFSEVIYLVTFKETGLPSGVTWYINVTGGGSYSSATTSLSFHDPNGTYSFTATDNDNKYRASSYEGSFTVNGASLNVSVPYVSVTYNVTFSESGLPSKSTWYVILNGSRESSNTSSITFFEFNGSYSFTVQEIVNGSYGKRYVDFSYTGSRNVTGKAVTVNVTYATQYYLLVSIIPVNGGTVSPLSGWYNSSAQVKINASAASSYIFESWSGTGSGSYSGQINPNTVTMNGPVNETASFEKTYAVKFTESGLPSGITWYLNVSGPTGPRSFYSSLDSITFHGPNGTYSYSLGTNTRYATTAPTGQIIVNGGNASANATFHLVTYTVDFIEIGLPSASLWSVSLNGTTSVPTNTSVISFTMPNGTYPYSVAPLSGVVIEPDSGNVVVTGQNVVVDIVFKTSGGGSGGNLVSFIESGLPANGEWFVTLNGYTESSFSSLIQFYVGNGTYSYSISTTSNAKVSPDFGNVTVTHNMEVTVIFSNSTSSPGSSTTTIVQKISDNLGLIIGSTAASIIIGWVLAIYVNPENRKKRSLKRGTRKGVGRK